MTPDQAAVGTRVRSLVNFVGVPAGTVGVIDEDYGSGVMVAWDLSGRRLPPDYREYAGKPAFHPDAPLRDGFDKETELDMLELEHTEVPS